MGRSPCCEKVGLKKGPWTPEEDQRLLTYIEEHGHGCWRSLPAKAGLQRCGKSCRLRWTNYLRPDIKRGKFNVQEEQTIIQLHALLGNRWSAIASHLPKRTDNEIKNFWNTHLKKRLAKMGIDPVTHKPSCGGLASPLSPASKAAANVSHMAQWESARLEAEARLARESKLLRFLSPAPDTAAAAAAPQPFQPLPPSSTLPVAAASTPAPALPPCFDALRAWQGVLGKPTKASSTGDGRIDLESPTSTLSFSESGALPLAPIALRSQRTEGPGGDHGGGGGEEMEGEEVDWRCFPKPMQLFDTKEGCEIGFAAAAAAFPGDSSTSVYGADHDVSPWLHESLRTSPCTAAAAAAASSAGGHFGDGLTEMLLNNSGEHHVPSESGGAATGAGSGARENEEQSKSYWSSILNLVDSASPSNSPDCVLV